MKFRSSFHAGCCALSMLCGTTTLLRAQSSAEAALRLPVTWASGTGAPTVRTEVAPVLSLNLGGPISATMRFSIDTRLSNTDIQLNENGTHWSGGTLTLVDVVGTLGWRPVLQGNHRASFEIGAGATVFAGSRDVTPFRGAHGVIPIGEGTFVYDLPLKFVQNTTAAFVRGTLTRIGGANGDDAVKDPGYVHRVSLGIRITHQ